MRVIPPGLQAHLDAGATTLCWCWRLTRKDGQVFGFTDHDRDLTFEGTLFEAASGLTASEVREAVGLAVDDQEVSGALTSDRLTESDLSAGRYDDAAVELYRANWQDVSQRLLVRTGSIGEVRSGPNAFHAEVRGLAHYLQQKRGRLYQYACDADVGDARCGVDLSQTPFRGSGNVSEILSPRRFKATGISGFGGGWFSRGILTWQAGGNAGLQGSVLLHEKVAGSDIVELWQDPAAPIQLSDSFVVTAGCDKHLATCRDKFANGVNYRGFSLMPGNDFVSSYPNSDDANLDGGSLLT